MSNTSHDNFHATALAAVNEALTILGQDDLPTELSTTSTDIYSRKAAFVYESARLYVLRAHPWSFARRVATTCGFSCAPCGGDPNMPFSTPVPPKCAKIISCTAAGGITTKYIVSGSEIYSEEPIETIIYTCDLPDLNRWSPDAYRALVLRLAADLAKPVTGRINERQIQEQAYNEFMDQAKLNDARSSNLPQNPWGENYYVEQMFGATRPVRRTCHV